MTLTNETLRAMVHGNVILGMNDVRPMAEELLTLRSMRDAGDDEVEGRAGDIKKWIELLLTKYIWDSLDIEGQVIVKDVATLVKEIADIAIARGRTRTDAVNKAAEWAKECEAAEEEIERLKKRVEAENGFAVKAGKMIDELTEENKRLHDEAEVADSLVLTLQEEVKTLTAERDEDREEIERLNVLYENDGKVIDRLGKEKMTIVKLFRFWVAEYSRLSPEEVIRRGEYVEDVQEIIDWLEE